MIRNPRGAYDPELEAKLTTVVYGAETGIWGVSVVDAENFQQVAGVHSHMRVEALSLSKLWVALAVRKAAQTDPYLLAKGLLIEESDIREGSGFLAYINARERPLLLGSVMQAMLRVSDTTGQRALVRVLGGPEAVNQLVMDRPELGTPLSATGLELADPADHSPEALFYSGHITPYMAASLLGAALHDPLAREALSEGIFSYGLRRDLPDDTKPDPRYLELLAKVQQDQEADPGDSTRLLEPHHPRTKYPNMMGIDGGMRHDVALISSDKTDEAGQPRRSYLVAVLSNYYDPTLPEIPDHPAHAIQAKIGKLILDYANRS